MEKRISGHTRLLALIGSPVGHSGSPAMYNYSFEKLGLDYAYVAFDVKEDGVKQALDAMKLFHMRGMNVTMPDKVEAAKYMDVLSPAAEIVGAVNTIVNEDGRLIGHMTDGEGFVNNLKDFGVSVENKKMIVAGGGGAATAIQVQCALDGAREIVIFNKNDAFFERTLATAEKIGKAVLGCKVRVYDIDDTETFAKEMADADIFVNATIVGMKPMEDQSIIKDTSLLRPELVVADIVYNPEETKLLKDAKEAGCICVGGKGMLVWQGASAFKLYTGEEMPVEEVKALLYGKPNVFLIGFMGCGKSTMARLLAEETGRELVEMDETIEAEMGISINEIFETHGEAYFRDLETDLVKRIAEKGNCIVSCGGGAVLRTENLEAMKKNGKILYLSATPETVYERVKDKTTRPLLNGNMNVEYISSLMEKRIPTYEAAADIILEVDGREKAENLERIKAVI